VNQYEKEAQKRAEQAINHILALKGRQIKNVEVRRSWRTKNATEIRLTLDNGTTLQLTPTTESGCDECDGDGRNETTIDVSRFD